MVLGLRGKRPPLGLVSLNLETASAGIGSDWTQNRCSRFPCHQSRLKILCRILFRVTALGVADSFLTLAIAVALSPTVLAELKPNLSHQAGCVPHALQFSLQLILQHDGSGPERSVSPRNPLPPPPPPPPLPRLPLPTVKAGGGLETVPCTGTVAIRNAPTMLRVIMREGPCANLKPAVFLLYQPGINAVTPCRGQNSHYNRPVTFSALLGVRLDTAALTTTASALRTVPGVLRTVALARSKVLPIQVTSADSSALAFGAY